MASLEINALTYRYGQNKVVDDLNLTVADNEIVCLLGASGCGKTTTLKLIAGLIQPEQGVIQIGGSRVNEHKLFVAPQHRNIGMMFQDYALFPHLNVAKNIAFGLKGLNKAQRDARVKEMLQLVQLEEFAARYPHELSGGQQQRVAIARALAYRPKLLLLDEPFSNIDSQVRFSLINDIRQIIKQQGVAAIFVTHSREEAFAFADKLAIMEQGKIAQLDSAEALYRAPANRYVAEFMGQGVYLDAKKISDYQVSTNFGVIHSSQPLAAHSTGQVYLRPQHMRLINGENHQIELLQQRYLGLDYSYTIVIEDQALELQQSARHAIDVNAALAVEVEPHAVTYFAHEA
ncbi:ABC transporter ATP-binding protein [Pseudoalteromonas fenneropenaei]|uniref:ABC transporter ATP-binding protein n=1 Tax=Pseudoalteromonas fenneropenaei TaxID=1737459 RepID=A0ABV7CHH1_9GAMM